MPAGYTVTVNSCSWYVVSGDRVSSDVSGCNGPLCVSGIVCLLVSDLYKGDVCGFETVRVCVSVMRLRV